MAKSGTIMRYTAEELAGLARRDGTLSNWAKVDALTDAEIEAAIATDSDEAGMRIDWDKVSVALPEPKAV
jgi:hypothetical protein